MRTFTAVKLQFLSPLHVGEPGVGVEKVLSLTIHSDTLWAAILYGWSRLGYELAPLEQEGGLPFRLSSAFPFLEGTFFFPTPVEPLHPSEPLEPHRRKELKKVRFFPQRIFEQWARGEALSKEAVDEVLSAWKKLRSQVVEYTEPHVKLGHASFASQIYYLGLTVFGQRAGLYFLVDWVDESLKERFFSVLNLLKEEGIGGKRSRGFGLFDWEEVSITLQIPEDGDHWFLLSTLIPEKRVIAELGRSTFRLYYNRGWSLSPTGEQAFRKPIWMILEGATFPIKPDGRIVDVTPQNWTASHKVFRHGVAFSLPFKKGGG